MPKTIPLHTVETFLSTIYMQWENAKTTYQRRNALRDAAVIELLFSTGMRISELCSLGMNDINLCDRTILIYGKGAKERRIQIGNDDVVNILEIYKKNFQDEIQQCMHFFATQTGNPLSDQSVRRMINKYASLAAIELHITPICSDTPLQPVCWKQTLTFDTFRKCWDIVLSMLRKYTPMSPCQNKEIFSLQNTLGKLFINLPLLKGFITS